MNGEMLLKCLTNGDFDKELEFLYVTTNCTTQRDRYYKLLKKHIERVGNTSECFFCSAPGRAEIGGNHTDHQNGRVLSAAVTLDVLSVVTPRTDIIVELSSDGYDDITVDLSSLAVNDNEIGTTASLIRGVAAGMTERGIPISGFTATVTTDVMVGYGISSSAAFEVLIATIFSNISNKPINISPLDISIICKNAENKYFGKPCGLLDQCTCAVGGFVSIDFRNPNAPFINRINVDISTHRYAMCLLNTGSSHENLTEEYAAIPNEMCKVAEVFGQSVLRGVTEHDLISALPTLRSTVSDRAILRAFHFVNENDRAFNEAVALESGNFDRFLQLIRESGESSERLLQNLFPVSDICERSLCLAQLITSRTLGTTGAWRVHGGGFAGTLQIFLPINKVDSYIRSMEMIFGKNSIYRLIIRPVGGYCIGK